MKPTREKFGGRAAVILAMAGSAIGSLIPGRAGRWFGPLADVKILGLFDFADSFASNVLLVLGGLIALIIVGWVMPKKRLFNEFTNRGTLKKNVKMFPVVHFLIRYVAPIGMLALILASVI